MLSSLGDWLNNPAFMPHGYCLRWDAGLLWSLVLSNLFIGLSYFAIAFALIHFLRSQKHLHFNWIFGMFAAFIFACGITHFVDVVSIWYPVYRLDALMLNLTAAASVSTAVAVWPLIPLVKTFLRQREEAIEAQRVANDRLSAALALSEERGDQLHKSEQQFRLTLTNAPIGLAVVSLEGRFLAVNNALCGILDYSESELLSLSFQDITHPDDLDRDLKFVQDLLDGRRECYRLEKRYIDRRGDVIFAQLDGSIVRDQRGQPLHFIAQIQNITSRKVQEAALRDNERRLQSLLDKLQVAVVVHGHDTAIRYANPTACAALGLTLDQMLGRAAIEESWGFVHEDGTKMPASEYPVNLVLTRRSPLHEHVVGVCRAGSEQPLWMLCNAVPEFGINGEIMQVVVSFVDISERKRLALELERQARTDSVTGMLNHRGFLEAAVQEVNRCKRYGRPLSVLFVDLDHFKSVNDRYGHGVGDQVLKHLAGILPATLRTVDCGGRLGGEEFGVLLPDCPLEQALETAERLRRQVESTPFPLGSGDLLKLSVSIGVASAPCEQADIEELLERADQAMYTAKRAGRNRVHAWQPPGTANA